MSNRQKEKRSELSRMRQEEATERNAESREATRKVFHTLSKVTK